MTKKTVGDYKSKHGILHLVPQVSRRSLAEMEQVRHDPNLLAWTHIPLIDNDPNYAPCAPGQTERFIARPGHGKSSWLIAWMRNQSLRVSQLGRKEMGIYITNEQPVEDLLQYMVAARHGVSLTKVARGEATPEEYALIQREMLKSVENEVAFVGYSTMFRGKEYVDTTIEAILEEVLAFRNHLEDCGIRLSYVLLDYLQRCTTREKFRTTQEAVSYVDTLVTEHAKNHGYYAGIAVQAKREVEDTTSKIPGADSAQWSSRVEQNADAIWTLVKPSRYVNVGETLGHPKWGIKVEDENDFIMTRVKARKSSGRQQFVVKFDPQLNNFGQREMALNYENTMSGDVDEPPARLPGPAKTDHVQGDMFSLSRR